MTWGKGGSTNVVHVRTNSTRRAASVPAASISYEPRVMSYEARTSYEPMIGSKTAHRVYSAKEDTDDMSQASRRHDQRLLSDIQTRLDQAAFNQPPVREPRSRSRRPSRPSSRRGSVSSIRRQSLADEDFEIFFPEKLTTKNLPPCARRALNRSTFERSSSVPPSPPSRRASSMSSTAYKSSGGGLIDMASPLFRVVDGGPVVKPSYMSTYARSSESKSKYNQAPREEVFMKPEPMANRRYSFAFEKPEELRRTYNYTPQLRTAHAYEFTKPRPFVRRHVPMQVPTAQSYIFRGEADYVPARITSGFRAASEPRRQYPVASLALKQARDSLGRIERELGMGSVSLEHDAPYFDEPIVHATHVVPVRATPTGWNRGSMPSGRRPSYTYGVSAARPPPMPSRTRQHEIEARLECMMIPEPATPPVSYANLRSRTSDARNKMDQHKVLLDRYLPCPMGTPNEVPYEVEYKFNELADRMPQLRPRERGYRASSLPPVRPSVTPTVTRAPVNEYRDSLRTPAFRPTMSDTRKRARDVLCRTKRDPHYFDY